MGGAPRTYTCIQISEVEWQLVLSYAKLQQIHHQDLLFADFIIADITSGLKICLFAEIAPPTIYPLWVVYENFTPNCWFSINLE